MAEENDIVEDFLEVDQKIPGQNFVCLSFISPEKVLKDKQKYFYNQFLKYVFQSEDKTIIEHLSNPELNYTQFDNIYEDWLYPNIERLETEFYENNDFKTSVRGVKIRGTYETLKEANIRAKVLQKRDPSFHVFVGQVGYWLPWDPESDKIEQEEYSNQHLNELVKNYKQNVEQRDEYFETVKHDKIKKAREENIKNKQNSNNMPDNKESENKISELRDIMDERDKILNEQISNRPSGDQSSAEQPSGDQPSVEQPSGDQSSAEQSSGDQSSAEQPSGDQSSVEQPSGDQPSTEQPSIEQPSVVQPSTEQPSIEQQFNLNDDDPWIKRKNMNN